MLVRKYQKQFSIVLIGSLIVGALLVGGLVPQTAAAQSDNSLLIQRVTTQATAALSADEAAGLLFMREEEKLAHDVYVTLAEQWNLPVFTNIAQSEQRHTDAVRTVLERYGLNDPAAGNPVGVFVDPALQQLYNDLIAQGSQSTVDALLVGTIIEETDILDLQTRIAQSDHADIVQLYSQLLRGSSNHLRAFVRSWESATREVFVPQFLDQESYDAIINDSAAPGRGGRGRRGR